MKRNRLTYIMAVGALLTCGGCADESQSIVRSLPPACTQLLNTPDPVRLITDKQNSLKQDRSRYRVLDSRINQLERRENLDFGVAEIAREDRSAARATGQKEEERDAGQVVDLENEKILQRGDRMDELHDQAAGLRDAAAASSRLDLDLTVLVPLGTYSPDILHNAFLNPRYQARSNVVCSFVLGQVDAAAFVEQDERAFHADHLATMNLITSGTRY